MKHAEPPGVEIWDEWDKLPAGFQGNRPLDQKYVAMKHSARCPGLFTKWLKVAQEQGMQKPLDTDERVG